MTDSIFDIPGDIIAAAESAQSFKLQVPDNARRHRREPNTFFWPEGGTIISAKSGSYLNERTSQTVTTYTVDVEINADGSGLNSNKPISAVFRLNLDAIKTSEPKSQLTMSLMSITKLKSLMVSLGIGADLSNGGYSKDLLTHYFPPEVDQFPSESSPLVGNAIYFEVKQGPRELPDGSTREAPEINRFLSSPVGS